MAVAKTFERALRFLVPSWLSEGEGGKAFTVIMRTIDEHMARGRASLELRFPTRALDDANAKTGEDRGIARGRTETSAHYAERLIAWRYPRGHRVRGSAFALLNQLSEYFGGITARTIDVKLNWHERTAAGVESFAYGYAWPWDGTSTPKGRFWMMLVPPAGAFSYTLEDVQAIRKLFTGIVPWNPAGTQPEWVIVSTDGSTPAPDGLWLHWSKNVAGTQVEARSGTQRFWSMAPARNNQYAGIASNYPALITECGGGTYAGNPANFPALLTLPSGATYVGNAANWPTLIQLFDDGDLA